MDKILRINMSEKAGPTFKEEKNEKYSGMGGRALTTAIIASEVHPMAHPLSVENKLVIAPGLLSGSLAAMSGRLSIGCKSPLTGGIKESNSGGQAAQVLARLEYAAIILEGMAPEGELYQILINKDGVKIEKAPQYKMLPNYDLIAKVQEIHGDKVACISIGPAGEMKLSASSIAITDMEQRPTRHAGRGGVGAVMGSKGVKLIILDDAGLKNREAADPEKFRAANRKFVEGLRTHAVTGSALPAYGTNVLVNIINEAGGLPTNNFQNGRFPGVSAISGETIADIETRRGANPTHGCHRGCVIRCSGTYHDKDGNFLTKQPEYETVWAHGANCGIDDPDTIAMLDYLDDNYGLDTIDMGAAVAVAMEAGLLKFGDGEGAINLIKEVGKGTPLGKIIGSGAAVTAKVLGVERAPVVKGQAIPAYDPRAIQGIGVTYATSTQGADHTAGYCITANILKVGGFVDPLKTEGQVDLSRDLQIATAAIDSTGMCLFIAFAILDQPETFQALIDMLNAFYGLSMTGDDVAALGKKILTMERDFNKKAGFTALDDRLPRYFYTEKLPPHDALFSVTDMELDSVFNW
ncbi:MAG: aldehyde ferredoxin oxidoreductase C-terminal domain-containing protein [Spirochaetota bacterium]